MLFNSNTVSLFTKMITTLSNLYGMCLYTSVAKNQKVPENVLKLFQPILMHLAQHLHYVNRAFKISFEKINPRAMPFFLPHLCGGYWRSSSTKEELEMGWTSAFWNRWENFHWQRLRIYLDHWTYKGKKGWELSCTTEK